MTRPRNWFACLVVAFALLVSFAPEGQARPDLRAPALSATINQCANRLAGTTGSINNCAGTGWVTGNLNVNNSVYRQGDFVPFRTIMGNLVAGRTYALDIGYDAVESGLHAYDYLGSYDASAFPGQQIVPCFGVGNTAGPHACGDDPSTFPVPTDTNTTFPNGTHPPPQPAGNFSVWGGALQDAVYTNTAAIGPDTATKVQRTMRITFVANGPDAVLAWGGHIASALDWGPARAYTSVYGGSPFHMFLGGQFCQIGGDCSNTGNQDLSLHAAALAPVPGLSTEVAPSSATIDQPVVDTATLTGVSGSGPVRGTVEFFVCFDATVPPNCLQGGTSIGFQNVVLGAGSNNGTASMEFTADQEIGGQGPGFYCFRVEYSPAPDALYMPALHTNTTTECFEATLPPPLLTVTKICDPENDPGLFNLLLDGSPVPGGTNVACGGSRGPFETTVGSHTVSESAGTGTSLGDYTSTISGDCAADGSILLALGDSAICTITNVRNLAPPPASLTVHKVCDPADDSGRFEIRIDGPGVSALNVATVGCGDSVGPVELAPGGYTVSEAGVPPTSLADYTTVISGDCAADGSVTLASGGSADCTITNTRNPPPVTTLRIDKVCDPSSDPGLFDLNLDGVPLGGAAGVDVSCGGTTGAVAVGPGSHTVSETAGTGTSLGNYTSTISGDCAADGSITLTLGQTATCIITNVHNAAPPPASLTVHKVCDPADDPGSFEILVDDQPAAVLGCGDSTDPLELAPGTYTVREAGGEDTSLADYTTVISGDCAVDGSVTLTSGGSASCTFTNTRIPPTTTLRVDKVCVPAEDDGRFKVLIATSDGTPVHRSTLHCGGSTGVVHVKPGAYVVRERGAGSTHLRDYFRFIGGDCGFDGTVVVEAGDQLTCRITNVRKGTKPLPAELTVTKICVPVDDGGRFDLSIGAQTERDVACGESFGPVAVVPGTHQVGESGGTGTDLSDYTTTIGGACAPDGSVTLAAGETATCTITNVRGAKPPEPPQTGTVEIQKRCSPAGTQGNFQLEFDEQVFRLACGRSTGPVKVAVGDHRVGEVVALDDNTTNTFETTIGGDCAANGSFTLGAGGHVTCVVTNTVTTPRPPLEPPAACYTLSARPHMATAGRRVHVVARVHVGRRPVAGVRVFLRGPRVSAVRTTGRSGRAVFVVTPRRRGVLRVVISKAFDCPRRPPHRIGVAGAATPPVTG